MAASRPPRRTESGSWFASATISAFVTASFYAATFGVISLEVPHLSGFLDRYFCSHPLEYISTAMFFAGLTVLAIKWLSLKNESQVHESAESQLRTDDSEAGELSQLEAWCQSIPEAQQSAQLFRRISGALGYLRNSARSGLEDHLKYLAELASERLHQSYATVRTITWAIPILGFLGTVMGITMAIANVTPEQLDTSLGEVTGGLSVAFDTTALALAMSIFMVFCSFLVERSEQNVLAEAEQFAIEVLLPRYGATDDEQQQSAASVINSDVWTKQLTSLKDVWSTVLRDSSGQLKTALASEVQQALQLHRESNEIARDVYSDALQSSSSKMIDHTERLLTTFDSRVSQWQDAISHSSESAARQLEAIHELGAVLLRMTETEERLAALQSQLNENLKAVELADTLEQTAASLTAAVHVLTARTSHRSAA